MKKRVRFEPKHGAKFRGVERLRPAEIGDTSERFYRLRDSEGITSFRVNLTDIDVGHETEFHTIPVEFWLMLITDAEGKKAVAIRSMSMRSIRPFDGKSYRRPISEDFGPDGKHLYSGFHGYSHALVALGTLLHRRGIEHIWMPTGDTVYNYIQHRQRKFGKALAGKIYDKTARRLGLGEPIEKEQIEGRRYRTEHQPAYYLLKTEDLKHLGEYLRE